MVEFEVTIAANLHISFALIACIGISDFTSLKIKRIIAFVAFIQYEKLVFDSPTANLIFLWEGK